MESIYQQDLAYIHSLGFTKPAYRAAPEIVRLMKSAPIEIRHVVDAGCGSGPLAEALFSAGFNVTGIDTSHELLEIARSAVPAANFIHGSIYELGIPPSQAEWHSDATIRRVQAASACG